MACEDRLVSRQHRLDRLALACAWSLSRGAVCARLLRRSGKGAPGQSAALQRGGRRCAPTPPRYSGPWPVAQLAALTAFAALEQARRVRRRSAQPRALRSSAPRRRAAACPDAPLQVRRRLATREHRHSSIERSTFDVTSHKSQVTSRKSQVAVAVAVAVAVQCSAVQCSAVEWSSSCRRSCSCSCSCCQRSARKHIVVLACQ